MTSAKNVANAVGGKTARACDSCITKRARWFCVADDAFLCQACDSSVHSANPLALRHERVHLKITSSSKSCAPSWHRGFTKKARTPRHGNNKHSTTIPFHLVPEVGYLDDTNSNEEREEQLLYRVPIFHPIVGELCTTPTSVATSPDEAVAVAVAEALVVETKGTKGSYNNYGVESIHGFLLSDIELDGFDADIESLLGKGLENQCMGMEELGLIDSKEENCNSRERKYCVGSGMVKEEKEEVAAASAVRACKVKVDQFEMGRETFESCFEYGGDHDESPVICKEVEEKVALDLTIDVKNDGEVKGNNQAKMNTLLQLDYEAVITAWASQKSPWVTAGDKLDFEPDQCWPHCMGTCGMELHHQHYVEFGGLFGGHPAMADGGREARVSRYREKRRTRLFSKKIRYEVRKLNAEKRPRMKGRFVKRASFAAPPTFPLLNK